MSEYYQNLSVGMRVGAAEVIADLSSDYQPVDFDDTDPKTWAYCWLVQVGIDYWLINDKAMSEGGGCEIRMSDHAGGLIGDVVPGFNTPMEALRWVDDISSRPAPLSSKGKREQPKKRPARNLDRDLNTIPGVRAQQVEQTEFVSSYKITFVDVSAGPSFILVIHKRNRAVSFKAASSLMSSWHINYEHLPRLAIVVTAVRAWLDDQEISEILST